MSLTRTSRQAGCSWRGAIPPATAVRSPASAISAIWSYWSRLDFTPEEAVKIVSANGAQFLGRIGTIAAGKNADLVLIDGNPAANINDVENVEVVFRNGIGFDSPKIFAAMKGQVGRQ
jgi:imidazolonepropionase-like amidohydrolase